MYESLHDHVVY